MSWPPDDAEALEGFLAEREASETHHIDFKRQVGGNANARRKLAEHLASFATDGGWLVVGVEEDKDTVTFRPRPLALEGQRERIDNVAHTAIDPPLYVETQLLPRTEDPESGYVLVRVPPSPHVVHSVDGRYWARRDTRKAALTDPDVERLMRLRSGRHDDLAERALAELDASPRVPSDDFYEMLVLCTPRTPQPRPLWDLTRSDALNDLQSLIKQAEGPIRGQVFLADNPRLPLTNPISAWLLDWQGWQRRPGGAACATPTSARTAPST